MANERRDEFAGWATKLEEPGALAGLGLRDREAVWDRLETRLGNPGRSRRRPLFWMAAACLAPLFALLLYIMKGRKENIPTPEIPAVIAAGGARELRPVLGPGDAASSVGLRGSGSSVGLRDAASSVGLKDAASSAVGLRGSGSSVALARVAASAARGREKPVLLTDGPGARSRKTVQRMNRQERNPAPETPSSSNEASSTTQASARQEAIASTESVTAAAASSAPDKATVAAAPQAAPKKQLRIISINELPDTDSGRTGVAVQAPVSSHKPISLGPKSVSLPATATRRAIGSALIVHLSSKYP